MNDTKKQVTESPGRDDVHEQREPDQPREGVVEKPEKKAEPEPPAGGRPAPSRTER
jgi:hypothetical protein